MRIYEFESKTKAEVYIDMDGVLVDFFDAWAKLMGEKSFRDIKDIDKGLQAIRDTDDFWLNLKPTPNAGKLLALVRKLKGSYTILSSPLADDPRSEPHKRMWVEKNLKQFPPKKVIITGNKAKYAQQSDGTPNILIDDFGQNIDKWNAAGGIGVKHKDHKFERTLQSLIQHLDKEEKVKETIRKVKGGYRLVSKSGKNLGTYPSKSGAEKRERQVQYFKHAGESNDNVGHPDMLPMPMNTVVIDTPGDLDWYKIGQHFPTLSQQDPREFGQGDSDMVISFQSEKEKQVFLMLAKKLGLNVMDIGGTKHQPEIHSEGWSDKYKRSINCNNPKGFSQKAHCAGRKKK